MAIDCIPHAAPSHAVHHVRHAAAHHLRRMVVAKVVVKKPITPIKNLKVAYHHRRGRLCAPGSGIVALPDLGDEALDAYLPAAPYAGPLNARDAAASSPGDAGLTPAGSATPSGGETVGAPFAGGPAGGNPSGGFPGGGYSGGGGGDGPVIVPTRPTQPAGNKPAAPAPVTTTPVTSTPVTTMPVTTTPVAMPVTTTPVTTTTVSSTPSSPGQPGFPSTPSGPTAPTGGGSPPTTTPIPSVPEPATWSLMLVGVGGLGAMLRRREAVA